MDHSSDFEPRPSSPEAIDIAGLAGDLGLAPGSVALGVEELERAGLIERDDGSTVLTCAGEQFLEMHGDVCHDALFFLAEVIDDLHARCVLLEAGRVLVEGFRLALLEGAGVAHARRLVPPAFTDAIDARVTYDLFAAAVALLARLSAGDPAGCIAEEILAVRLIEMAETLLQEQVEVEAISEGGAATAKTALRGIYELFEDDDVLELFEMHEPSDAASGQGDVDQRFENWFQPFGGTPSTGHLEP